jgi:hypothetical protein
MIQGQSASLSWCQAAIWGPRPDFYRCQTVAGLLMWGALSDDRTGLSFTVVAGPRQCSHSQDEFRGTDDHILQFEIRDPQPGGPSPRIYIPQEQGGPVMPPGTGFLFCRLLRHAGLWWSYSYPPSLGDTCWLVRVTLRLADYRQSVRLGAKPLGTHDHYFFSTELLRS